MKSARITLIAMCLLLGATLGPMPTPEAETQTVATSAGDCYLLNGIWFCEP